MSVAVTCGGRSTPLRKLSIVSPELPEVATRRPGQILYRDAWQIVAKP
jgi:hypothetical protein